MLKKILILEGAQKLTKNEQKSVNGGSAPLCPEGECVMRVLENGRWIWICNPC